MRNIKKAMPPSMRTHTRVGRSETHRLDEVTKATWTLSSRRLVTSSLKTGLGPLTL